MSFRIIVFSCSFEKVIARKINLKSIQYLLFCSKIFVHIEIIINLPHMLSQSFGGLSLDCIKHTATISSTFSRRDNRCQPSTIKATLFPSFIIRDDIGWRVRGIHSGFGDSGDLGGVGGNKQDVCYATVTSHSRLKILSIHYHCIYGNRIQLVSFHPSEKNTRHPNLTTGIFVPNFS